MKPFLIMPRGRPSQSTEPDDALDALSRLGRPGPKLQGIAGKVAAFQPRKHGPDKAILKKIKNFLKNT